MTDTGRLVRRLITNVVPVRPLPNPWIRAATWCGVSLPVLGVVIIVMSRSSEAAWADADRRVVLEQLAALATGVTAAAAALATTVPGYRRWIVLLPLVPLAVWLGDLGQWCIQDGLAFGFPRWSTIAHWRCLPATILMGTFPGVAIVLMLRRGVPLTPRLTTLLAAIAAGSVANFGVRFVHGTDAGVVVFAWHFGAVFMLSAASPAAGRVLFNWQQFANRRHAVA